MQLPHSKLYQKNNQRLIPVMMKKGIITKFYPGANAVDLYFVENPQTIIKSVILSFTALVYFETAPTNTNVRCVVDVFDESNTGQMIVAYVY